ncbi:Fic family protein [Geovibrio thiophilus]|uniref:Fic family protein n=1 Tax=Geovibrio thiophilus TaxID=139438 RepID=A0A410K1H3_9BACT|nr:Fic family protein [Geovibrio thiophilus]QAR34155.1 Fic family protein [Geovibrio thiophilus]
MIRQIITERFERITFSGKYDEEAVASLMKEADARFAILSSLPVTPYSYSFLDEIHNKCIYSSLTVQKNNMKSEDALNLLRILQDSYHRPAAEKALANLRIVYGLIDSIVPSAEPFVLTPDFVKRLHMHITFDVRTEGNIPGSFRTKSADIKYFRPPEKDIAKLIKEFCDWFNTELRSAHPLIRACLAHYHLSLLHPFGDGNGRTARSVEAAILRKAGYRYLYRSIGVYYKENRTEYYRSFRKSEKTGGFDLTAFVSFFLEGACKSFIIVTDVLLAGLRICAVKDFFEWLKSEEKITERQYGLLHILFEADRMISEEELFRNKAFAGLYDDDSADARDKDLRNLADTGIIFRLEGGFELNRNLPQR